jgi:hypothetical protein
VNTLQDVSLLQSPNTLILLHLTRTDLVLSLHRLVTKGLDAQVDLVPIRVSGAKEPHVSCGVTRALSEVKEWGGIKVVGVRGGAASAETVYSGVVSELHLGELSWPDTSVWPPNGHRHVLHT